MAALSIVPPNSDSVFPALAASLPEAPTPPAEDTITPAEIVLCVVEDQLSTVVELLDRVPAEQAPELRAEIAGVMDSVDGRDKMGRLLTHLEAEPGFVGAEIKRLQARKALYERVLEQLEQLLIGVIQDRGKDGRGKWTKLAGRISWFTLGKLPPSVVIDDECAVPSACRRAEVKLPAVLWEEILDALPVDLAGRVMDEAKRKDEVSKTAVKQALEAQAEVAGARLATDRLKLVRG